VHLGRRDDAVELAEFLLGDRRPLRWNQWPEISWRDPRSPGHLGDVPHTWIGAEYVLSFRSQLAYERQGDQALVLAAGIPASWLDDPAGVGAGDLPTYWGRLDFRLRRDGSEALVVELGGDLEPPPGGVVLRPPLPGPLVSVTVNGEEAPFDADGATIRVVPAHVVLRFREAAASRG
jgi:hypothetical protein